MGKLKTTYMGLELESPVIAGACDLAENPSNLKKIQKAGAGALVYKSLFEEQVQLEDVRLYSLLETYNERNAEMTHIFPGTTYAGPEEFLEKLKLVKKNMGIPVIGSINAVYEETWVSYAQAMEQTGVDCLELNFFNVPFSLEKTGAEIEEEQVRIVERVVSSVKLPVSVKLSPYYSNLLNFLSRLNKTGISGFVLFNKLFQPDIDLDLMKHTSPWNLSNDHEYRLSLRYAGLLFGENKGEVAGSCGIMDGEDMIKLLLAGAQAVQVVSTLYRNGIERIDEMNATLKAWMNYHGFTSIEDFRGKLSRKNTANPTIYKRAQYIDMMLNSNKLIGKPLV
ncbi:MAG: dihydroorotate dehydrogenase-like protein [Bacteroidales bacterium]